MDRSADQQPPGIRSTEDLLRDAAEFHTAHASDLTFEPAAQPHPPHRRWARPALAAAVVAAVVGGIIVIVQADRPSPTRMADAPAGGFTVVTEQLDSSSCSDGSMAPAVSIPGGDMPGAHLEAGLVGNTLCVGALGAQPRGWAIIDRTAGPVPYFGHAGFNAPTTDDTLTSDWFAYGAVDDSVDTIRFLPQSAGAAQFIPSVATLGDLRIFSHAYRSAGTLEFLSRGTVVVTKQLESPVTRMTMSTSAPAPTGRPCANPAQWEASREISIHGAVAGDSATAAHDTTSAMGRDLICVRLSTATGRVLLAAQPNGNSVYQLFTTYEIGDSRFMIARFTAVVTHLTVRVAGHASLTFGPDILRPDEMGFITVVARIPPDGDISATATDSTGRQIGGPLPDTPLTEIAGP